MAAQQVALQIAERRAWDRDLRQRAESCVDAVDRATAVGVTIHDRARGVDRIGGVRRERDLLVLVGNQS